MTISTICSELLILSLPNFVWRYIIICQSVLRRNWIVVFKVQITAEFQNVSECLSRWYLLNCWTFYYQTCYDDASSWAIMTIKKFFFKRILNLWFIFINQIYDFWYYNFQNQGITIPENVGYILGRLHDTACATVQGHTHAVF